MSSLLLTLLFDVLLAVLLIITIRYCSKLSQRIRMLQDSRGELAGMIAQFDASTEKAMTSLAELQSVSKKITDALQLKIEKANFLADDLAFLIEKSTKLAAQLEQAKTTRPEVQASKPASAFESKPLFEVTGPQLVKPKSPPPAQNAPPATSRDTSSLEAVLQRLAAANTVAPAATQKAPTQNAPRTDAERELLEALKLGR